MQKNKLSKSRINYSQIIKSVTFLILTSFYCNNSNAQSKVGVRFEWLGSTSDSTAEFDIFLTNLGTTQLKFNSINLRGDHNIDSLIFNNGTSSLGIISWISLPNTAPLSVVTGNSWNNWPNVSTNLGYTNYNNMFYYNSSTSFFTSSSAPTIPTDSQLLGGVNIGRFKINLTGDIWKNNAQFGFDFGVNTSVVAYVDSSTTTIPLATNNINIVKTVSVNQPLVSSGIPTNTINNSISNDKVSIYPNPTNNDITVRFFDKINSEIKINIIDLNGRIIKSKQVNTVIGENMVSINLSDLPIGLYNLHLMQHNKMVVSKLITKE